MIRNQQALRPEYVPSDLYHRDGQLDLLSTCFQRLSAGIAAENVCIFGPSGSGKTTIAKYILEQVNREFADVRWGYANCLTESSLPGVLDQLLDDMGMPPTLHRKGTDLGSYLDAFRNTSEPIVAVIDEAYVLADRSLLASLYELDRVSWIVIAIKESSFMADLDPGVESRVRSAQAISLDAYTVGQLEDILWGRIDIGLVEHHVDAAAVEAIARRADGNARNAIAVLRRSANHVQSGHASRLTPEVVAAVAQAAVDAVHEDRVRSLGTHKRLLYEIVKGAGSIPSGALHAAYEARVAEPKSPSTRRRYLESLEEYDLIDARGSTSDREYDWARG